VQYLTLGGDFLAKSPDFELVGRGEELRLLSSVLMRRKANSAILVGPGGVGATALCMGLQASKDDPKSPFDIISKRLFWLEYDDLFGSGMSPDDTMKAFLKVVSILKRTPDSILVVEDARDFIESARNSGCSQAINALNAAVADGLTQVILETKDDDLGHILKAHADMRECYTIISLSEPTGEDLLAIAKSAAGSLVKHHSIRVSEGAVLKAVELTNRYQTRDPSLSRAQPERTSTLLDRALASLRLTAHRETTQEDHDELQRLYENQRTAEVKVIELEEEIERVKRLEQEASEKGQATEAKDQARSRLTSFMTKVADAGYESDAVRELRRRIDEYQSVIGENARRFEELASRINENLELTELHVLEEFARLSGIPVAKLNQDEREKLKGLRDEILRSLWGQDHVVDHVVNSIITARIGRRNRGKPQASYMFLGPSGVGKTELVKILSRVLDMELLRFDMSEYMEKNAVNTLIGAPSGYEGYENGGTLTKAIKKNPRQIVLFDEIEKADPAVFNIFLQVLDAGRLTDRFGQTVSFSEAIVIMTSNIGQEQLLDFELPVEVRHSMALDALTSTPGVRPEFLNRFNGRQNIMFFNHLDLPIIEKIVKREIDDIDATYGPEGIDLEVSAEVISQFSKDHYDVRAGGRGLPGFIQSNLEPMITNKLLEDDSFRGRMIVGYDGESRRLLASFEGGTSV
jgi:ATP-dependent Clp protease ATP-binding subunit ClpB